MLKNTLLNFLISKKQILQLAWLFVSSIVLYMLPEKWLHFTSFCIVWPVCFCNWETLCLQLCLQLFYWPPHFFSLDKKWNTNSSLLLVDTVNCKGHVRWEAFRKHTKTLSCFNYSQRTHRYDRGSTFPQSTRWIYHRIYGKRPAIDEAKNMA